MEVYRQIPGTLNTLECSKSGLFRFQGREIFPYCYTRASGKKMCAALRLHTNGKRYFWSAAKLVAKTWSPKFNEDNQSIIYKDGNIHNIALDNLILIDEKTFYKSTKGRKEFKNLEEQKEQLQRIIEGATLTLNYFKTLDMKPINKHVEQSLYPYLTDYCNRVLCYGKEKSRFVTACSIAIMYNRIMDGNCVFDYRRFCKTIIRNYWKTGNFEKWYDFLRKKINIEVEHLNFDCLCEKYKVTKQKQ